MIKRQLGNTGISVSEIAFGGVEIGMPYGIGIKGTEDMLSENEAVFLLHSAVDAGINFFDTARLYGNSESIMGKAFRGRRDEVVLSTKCRHLRLEDGTLPDGHLLKAVIKNSLSESLAALQTDYADIFMLHTADKEILENDEIAHTFSELKRSGIIRATGVSTYVPAETEMAIEADAWDVVQLPFNLLDQQQVANFKMASQKGVGIIVRSVLMKGLLSDRGKNLHPKLKSVEQHIQLCQELVKGNAVDLSELAIRFALSFEEVASVLIGIDKQVYLNKSLEAANGTYLSKENFAKACDMAYPDPEFLNLHTWSRKGWLK